MISLPDRVALESALRLTLPPSLHTLLADILLHAEANGLLDLTYVIIVEPSDTQNVIADEVGFSPLTNPIDGIRYDQPGFIPYWTHLDRQGDWYRLIHTIGNDGFAFVLLIHGGPLEPMCHLFTTVPL